MKRKTGLAVTPILKMHTPIPKRSLKPLTCCLACSKILPLVGLGKVDLGTRLKIWQRSNKSDDGNADVKVMLSMRRSRDAATSERFFSLAEMLIGLI